MSKAAYIPRLNRDRVERIVIGCIRSCIEAHGPIGPEWIQSAAKRITNQLLGEIAQHIEREKAVRAAAVGPAPRGEQK